MTVVRPDGFCAELWRGSQSIFDAILAHPFVTGLTDGSLPRAAFEFYVVQDALYLRGYARALSLVSAHASDATEIALFATHAADAIGVERALHGGLLGELGIDPRTVDTGRPAPATSAYVDHLIAATATGSYADGIAAVLPCYWIYAEVGRHLLVTGSPDPVYAQWIQAYGGDDFTAVVQAVLDTAERIGNDLGGADRDRAATLYRLGARHEWMFWDAAWSRREWPVR